MLGGDEALGDPLAERGEPSCVWRSPGWGGATAGAAGAAAGAFAGAGAGTGAGAGAEDGLMPPASMSFFGHAAVLAGAGDVRRVDIRLFLRIRRTAGRRGCRGGRSRRVPCGGRGEEKGRRSAFFVLELAVALAAASIVATTCPIFTSAPASTARAIAPAASAVPWT